MSLIDDMSESQLLDRLICLDAEIRRKHIELRLLSLQYEESTVLYRRFKGFVEPDDDKFLGEIRSEIDKCSSDSPF